MSELQILRYTIKLLSPLVLYQSHNEENLISSRDEIPGVMLWGALAGIYIRENQLKSPNTGHSNQDKNFQKWFNEGRIIFKNAVLIEKDDADIQYLCYDWPQALKKKKNSVDDTIYNLLNRKKDEPYTAKQNKVIIKEKNYYKASVKKKIHFHHKRNRKTGSSEHGKIFHYEALQKGQNFAGYIIGEKGELQNFKDWLDTTRILYLGRSRSAEYGKVLFDVLDENTNFYNDISNPLNPEQVKRVFFLSDTIIPSSLGFSGTDINTIQTYFNNINLKVLEKDYPFFLKQKRIEGYNAKWRLRVPSESCIEAGSCFFVEGNEYTDWKELVLKGIGLRSNRGYGDIRFDLFIENSYSPIKIEELQKNDNIKVLEKPSIIIRNLYLSLVRKKLESYIEYEAAKVAEQIYSNNKKRITDSLLGRVEYILIKNFEIKNDNFKKSLDRIYHKEEKRTFLEFVKTDYSKHIETILNSFAAGEKMEHEGLQKEKELILSKANEYSQKYKLNMISYIRKKIKAEQRTGGKKVG